METRSTKGSEMESRKVGVLDWSEWTFEQCPVHGADVKKEYTFGKYGDCDVYKYKCGCCVVAQEGAPMFKDPHYCTSWNEAAGIARLIVMGEAVKNQAFA